MFERCFNHISLLSIVTPIISSSFALQNAVSKYLDGVILLEITGGVKNGSFSIDPIQMKSICDNRPIYLKIISLISAICALGCSTNEECTGPDSCTCETGWIGTGNCLTRRNFKCFVIYHVFMLYYDVIC